MTPPDKLPDVNWAALLANVKVVDLKAVRDMQEATRKIFEFRGPPEIGSFVRLFRLTSFFAFISMKEKRFPVLNRAWADLQWILRNPAADEFSVASWTNLDLPVTDDGRTLVEVFGAEIAPDNEDVTRFVDVTRKSRYGIYVDDGGTRRTHRLVELFTRRRVTVLRGVDVEPGELIWTRVIEWGGQKFLLGDTRGWLPAKRQEVTDMLAKRISEPPWLAPSASVTEAYERFMKLAGPYWFSMLYAQSEDDPVLEPTHYLGYRNGPVPDLPVPTK